MQKINCQSKINSPPPNAEATFDHEDVNILNPVMLALIG